MPPEPHPLDGAPAAGRDGVAIRGGSPGFSMIELLMVAAVAGLLASTAMMAIGERGEPRLNLAETQIRDALDFARAHALSTRRAHGVVFEPATDRFAVVDEAGVIVGDPLVRRAYIIDFMAPNQPRVDIQTAFFGPAGSTLLFDADGLAMTTGQIALACEGATRTLVLDQATGRMAAP